MKKLKKLGLLIFCLVSLISFTSAADYKYTNLDINADILIDGTINVTETFTANFYVKKHGIIREIPLNYSVNDNKFHIEISSIKVNGKKYTTKRKKGKRIIKIGDPNVEVYGKVVYPIGYSAYGLIKNFSGMGYSELYWNIIGHEFDTNIEKVSATINLPKSYTGFKNSDFLITTDGIGKTIDKFKGTVDRSQGDKIIITYDKNLLANQGITLAIKFPNNYFEFDHKKQAKLVGNAKIGTQRLLGFIENIINNTGSILKILIFIIIGTIVIISIKKGNLNNKINLNTYQLKGELSKKYHTVIQYTPPKGLNSAEVGLLLHRNAEFKDLFSLIYKRAAEGLITIDANIKKGRLGIEILNNIKIKKIKEIPNTVPEFEQNLFKSLLEKDEINLVGDNKKYIDNLTDLENHGINQGWLIKKKTIGTILLGFLLFLLVLLVSIFHIVGFILIIIYAIVFKNKLNAKFEETEKGAELIAHILGYRQFLAKCDEPVLKKFLAEDPLFFDKTLPYAVVFGLETEFLKKITPILEEKNLYPNWYIGDIHDIGKVCLMTNSIGSSYNESGGFSGGSSFGGGGGGFSSGGGGGGGGGHSW